MHKAARKRPYRSGARSRDKTAILGMIERGGRGARQRRGRHQAATPSTATSASSRARVPTLHRRLPSYSGSTDFEHRTVDHAEPVRRGNVHTNGMENFWSLLKRGLHGTYVSVEPFHLFRYLDERLFTFNVRDLTDLGRFTVALQRRSAGNRLTYDELTGKSLKSDGVAMCSQATPTVVRSPRSTTRVRRPKHRRPHPNQW